MIERNLYIGRWTVHFLFATDSYDKDLIEKRLYDADASYEIIDQAFDLIDKGGYNCGFTYTNPNLYLAVVVIGPTTNGDEFLNTVVHEVHHLAVAIADNLGIDLEGETPAYLSGDTTRDLADVICHLGCSMCN